MNGKALVYIWGIKKNPNQVSRQYLYNIAELYVCDGMIEEEEALAMAIEVSHTQNDLAVMVALVWLAFELL